MQITRLVRNYFINESLTEDQFGKPHRVISNWETNNLYHQSSAIVIILQDIELLMNVLTTPKKYSKVYFWHSEKNQRIKARGFEKKMNNVEILDTLDEVENLKVDWTKAEVAGNMAFSIIPQMVELFYKQQPSSVKQISSPDWVLAIDGAGTGHTSAVQIRKKLLELGLKKIVHLPYKFFQRVEKENKLDVAQIGAVYFETEFGYDGDIEVCDFKQGTSYFAKRYSSGFPRTEFAYKLRHTQPKISLPPCVVFNADSKFSYNDVNSLHGKKFYLAVRHSAGGGGIKPDPENGLLSFLQTAKIVNRLPTDEIDCKNLELYDWFIFIFDNKSQRDSFKSLCDLPMIQQAMSDMNFKMQRYTRPGMMLLPDFKLNKNWTQKDVDNHVAKYYKR